MRECCDAAVNRGVVMDPQLGRLLGGGKEAEVFE